MLTIIITSILVGLIFAPLGCLVLWKKYVYFSDGLAHASLLAGVLSIMLGVNIELLGLVVAGVFTAGVLKAQNNQGTSAAIGITSSIMIALSIILSDLFPSHIDINNLLFGDIITATNYDVLALILLLLTVCCFFIFFYKSILLIVIGKDLAYSREINVNLVEIIFLLLLSFAILIGIKIVGALLITSIIIIPPMTARLIASSPLNMIIYALVLSLFINILSIISSYYLNLSFAPINIIIGGIVYIITYHLLNFCAK